MSRSWRREIRVAVYPDRIAALTVGGLWQRRVEAHASWTCAAAAGPDAWQPVIETLSANVGFPASAARLRFILSGRCVRYTCMRPPGGLSASERNAYVLHKLKNVYGDLASRWTVRASPPDRDGGLLIAAVDSALVEAINQASMAAQAPRASIQPHLSLVYNRIRARLARKPTWFVIQEQRHAIVGCLRGGLWQSVAVRQCHQPTLDGLLSMLDREHALQGLADFCPDVCLVPATSSVLTPSEHARYKVEIVSLVRPAGFPIGEDIDYALAA